MTYVHSCYRDECFLFGHIDWMCLAKYCLNVVFNLVLKFLSKTCELKIFGRRNTREASDLAFRVIAFHMQWLVSQDLMIRK